MVTSLSDPDVTALTPVDGTPVPLYGLVVVGVDEDNAFALSLTVPAGLPSAWNSLVDVDYTIYRGGEALTSRVNRITAAQQLATAIANRRVVLQWPPIVVGPVGTTSMRLPGYYRSAAWAARIASIGSVSPFTDVTIDGFTGLERSLGHYTDAQMDALAGAGVWIDYQPTTGAPLRCRQQLSTDPSTLVNREVSLTVLIDEVSRLLLYTLAGCTSGRYANQRWLDDVGIRAQAARAAATNMPGVRTLTILPIGLNEEGNRALVTYRLVPYLPVDGVDVTLEVA